MVELSVVIPSRERETVLDETLRRLIDDAAGLPVELIVVYDGPARRAAGARGAWRPAARYRCALPSSRRSGPPPPATAASRWPAGPSRSCSATTSGRSRGCSSAIWSSTAQTRRTPRPSSGWSSPPLRSTARRFIRWLHTAGVQFGYGGADPRRRARDLLLDRQRLREDRAAARRRRLRRSVHRRGLRGHRARPAPGPRRHAAQLRPRGRRPPLPPDRPAPDARPDAPGRPRLPAALRARPRARDAAPSRHPPPGEGRVGSPPSAPREATWRFLCDEAQREAFWDVEPREGRRLRIGEGLARRAIAAESESEGESPRSAAVLRDEGT